MEEIRQIGRVKLGNQGLKVSRLGFGCGGLSGILNAPLSHEDGCSIIKEAFNNGKTFFDIADFYSENHDNEIMVGKALKQLARDQIQLATKFGIVVLEGLEFEIKGAPKYVRYCCESSLKRLNVDYIDLYYQHRVDTLVLIEETMIFFFCRQAFYLCKELGIGIVAYSPLGHGFFSGKAVVESFPDGSLMHGSTVAQLALAWLIHQGDDIVPIPGTTKVKNIKDNIGSLALKLTQEDLKEICDAVPTDDGSGPREAASIAKYAWKFADTPIEEPCVNE
ncbi:transmembrane emp24 domain-containing protein A [Hibiscus syriacus]|uniref:Transmembrane emp24 domain-containing protein A n=1 Tax=Hibiscus syriacus TaxID=106335 RepID=A0A6A2XTC9_HIBSY|nr:transmembrane emp24 domain-containing protein A [Hibiscus syriacus]